MDIFPLQNKILRSSTVTKSHNTVTVQLGDGRSKRAGIGVQPFTDVWSMQFELGSADANILLDFFRLHGLVKAFQFTSPLGDTNNYIFSSPPSVSSTGFGWYKISVSIKQVNEILL